MFGRRKPPRPLRPKLEAGERLLAWARTADDPPGAVVVTTLGLFLPGRARLGWHQIHKATWSGARLTVIPAVPVGEPVPMDGGSYAVMADGEPVTVALPQPGDVPAEVRNRVTRSVAFTVHHPLPAGGGVRIVGRRVPGVDGLAWHVRHDEGTPAEDPSVVAATTELVAEAAAPAQPD